VKFRVEKRSLFPYWYIHKCVANNNQHEISLSQFFIQYLQYLNSK